MNPQQVGHARTKSKQVCVDFLFVMFAANGEEVFLPVADGMMSVLEDQLIRAWGYRRAYDFFQARSDLVASRGAINEIGIEAIQNELLRDKRKDS